jgi:hypothetical protein
MSNNVADRFREALITVCPGTARIGDMSRASETAHFAPDASASAEQMRGAERALEEFDWSEQAHQAWTFKRVSMEAVQWVAGSIDPAAVAVRVLLRDLYTGLNDEQEARGKERVKEKDLAARLVQLAQAGGGVPIRLE